MTFRLRSSLLAQVPDCPRRAAAIGFPDLFKLWGYPLNRSGASIGRLVGKAVHVGSERWWKRWASAGAPPAKAVAIDAALDQLRDETAYEHDSATGLIYDPDTADDRAAETQTKFLMSIFHDFERTFRGEPVVVEGNIVRGLSDTPHQISATADLFMSGGTLYDRKTGRRRPLFGIQGGQSSRLLRAEGHDVKEILVGWGKRSRNVVPVQSWTVPQGIAEREADAMARHFLRDLETFRASGSTLDLPANPSTFLCSRLYCPAHGTTACNAWRMKG